MTRPAGRDLARTLLECAAGALLALLAASRVWRTVAGAGAVPGQRLTGGAVLPWAPPVALVGLAGAGALLATRGRIRVLLGALVMLAGLPLAIGGVYEASTGRSEIAWPVLLAVGGLLIGHGGLAAVRRGAAWPALGSRYERPGVDTGYGGGYGAGYLESGTEPDEPVERAGPSRSDVAMWDALDRGEDPTGRGE